MVKIDAIITFLPIVVLGYNAFRMPNAKKAVTKYIY